MTKRPDAALAEAIKRRRSRRLGTELDALKRTNPRAFQRYADLVFRASETTPPQPVPSPNAFLRDYMLNPERYPPDPDSWEAQQPELAARYYARETQVRSSDEDQTTKSM